MYLHCMPRLRLDHCWPWSHGRPPVCVCVHLLTPLSLSPAFPVCRPLVECGHTLPPLPSLCVAHWWSVVTPSLPPLPPRPHADSDNSQTRRTGELHHSPVLDHCESGVVASMWMQHHITSHPPTHRRRTSSPRCEALWWSATRTGPEATHVSCAYPTERGTMQRWPSLSTWTTASLPSPTPR